MTRQVFCVMGLPLDALDLPILLQTIATVVDAGTPFLLSTPNVNFLMMSRSDKAFRFGKDRAIQKLNNVGSSPEDVASSLH